MWAIRRLLGEAKLQPVLPTSGKFYHQDRRDSSIEFVFCPEPTKEASEQAWLASLEVKCDDVTRLMREGFHWSDANVIKEEGYIDNTTRDSWNDTDGWEFRRRYFLKDLQENPPRWIAMLTVSAPDQAAFCLFRLDRLSRENVQKAEAWNLAGDCVYGYVCGDAGYRLNAVYDDMPLEGWWPWPRKD